MGPHPARSVLSAAPALALAATLVGCGVADSPVDGEPAGGEPAGGEPVTRAAEQPSQGDVATWALEDDALLNPGSTMFVAGVTRLGCASGETGDVLEPSVEYEQDRVLVRTDVAPFGSGVATCQSNDTVPVEVHLDEPLGLRELVDGACLEGEAVRTAACLDHPGLVTAGPDADVGVRWAPPADLELADGPPGWVPPEDYSFTVQSWCGEQGFIGEYAVTVRASQVVAVEALRRGWDEIPLEAVPGLAEMLDLARDAAERGEAEVWTDPDGVPRWMMLDPRPRSIDDENCFLITDYEEWAGS